MASTGRCFDRSTDRTAVSGTANAGSIPARSAMLKGIKDRQNMTVLFFFGLDPPPGAPFMVITEKERRSYRMGDGSFTSSPAQVVVL